MNEYKKTGRESAGMGSEFVITRVFDAPREMVWKMWIDPELVKQWFGPQGFTAPVIKSDFRVGGRYLYDMRDPEGKDYRSAGEYREIAPNERIVATDYFADEQGNPCLRAITACRATREERLVTMDFRGAGRQQDQANSQPPIRRS